MMQLLLFFIFSSDNAFAIDDVTTPSYLTVLKIEGSILIWPPMATNWERISVGHRIYGEPLIQATENSKIIVKRSSTLGDSENLTLIMTGPTILRLRSKLNRQIVLTTFSMNTDRNDLPQGTGLAFKVAPTKNLPTAWERVKKVGSLLLNLSEEDVTLISPKEPSRAMSVNTMPPSLKIKLPVDGSAFMVERFPTHIPLVWEQILKTESQKFVDIIIENERTRQTVTTLRTEENAIAIPIEEPGIYKISISAFQEKQEDIASCSISVESPDHQLDE